jgi:hypothetical protein
LALDDAQQLTLVNREVDVNRIKLIDLAEGGLLPRGTDKVAGSTRCLPIRPSKGALTTV